MCGVISEISRLGSLLVEGSSSDVELTLISTCHQNAPAHSASKTFNAFGGLTAQRGWARLILDRFYDLLLSPGNPMAAMHEPESVSHEHRTFFFPGRGHGTANTAGFDWRGWQWA